jgi:hypothetical protein
VVGKFDGANFFIHMKTIELRKVELVPDKYGHHIKIGMVRLNDENGMYVKFLKIDEKIIKILSELKIPYNG